jgi:succinyl-diaminopimelate desuccinylase
VADHGPAREQLLRWLRLLVDASAVTGDEAALADELAEVLGADHDVTRVGDSLVVGGRSGQRPCVALVGHLDVVPPTDADRVLEVATRDGGEVAVGRGTSDMHGGNAVALELFTSAAVHADASPYDVVLVLYAREEGPADDNELADVLAEVPWLAQVDLAVVLEPTDGEVQAGCLGGLHATVTFTGRQAHSARPWQGRNALTAAGRLLSALDDLDPLEVEVDGITYRDVWSATQAHTDSARNVIPGSFSVNLNLRFAPSRDAEQATEELRERVEDWTAGLDDVTVGIEVVDVAPPAPPRLDAPLVRRLVESTDATVAAKQAWTDVARFAQLGVPAVNYGPGRTDQAHQRGEYVELDALDDVHARLARFLAGQ